VGVATLGLGLSAQRDGDRVAVEHLRVVCVGIATVAPGGVTLAAGGTRVALDDLADVALSDRRQLRRLRQLRQ
jgi:hypothetical protein